MVNIRIFYDDVNFRMKGWRRLKKIIEEIIRIEKKIPGNINYIITTDQKLKELNIKFLKRYYYTDVITFNYNENNIIKGEIYISLDTVKRNSINYKVSLKCEMLRVVFHGILHLCGYNDKTEEERIVIKKMEEKWMTEYDYMN